MEDIVKAAMAKWPNVPAVYGWLQLTARGAWKIRGEPIDNAAIRDFIGRNYTNDGCGNWFFQNGPQRVYVTIEATPLVYRLDEFGRLQAHTGARPRKLRAAFTDGEGHVLIETDLGPGLLSSTDTATFANRLRNERDEPLDDQALARFADGLGEAFLDPRGLHVECEQPIRIERVAGRWQDLFGFVAEPGGGKVS